MGIVRILLLVVEAACGLLLIGVILLQKSKSEGLGMAFGSGMGEALFGSRTGNVLTKITITLGITFLVTTTLLAMISTSSRERSLIDERVADQPSAPAQEQSGSMPLSVPPTETPPTVPDASPTPAMPAMSFDAQSQPSAAPAEAPVETPAEVPAAAPAQP